MGKLSLIIQVIQFCALTHTHTILRECRSQSWICMLLSLSEWFCKRASNLKRLWKLAEGISLNKKLSI